ncbi:hypothetical protein BT67DRAFT_189605 [Trichocladium antarcticum]|uniref:Uncharacterized protein n=1 Tax=Trichocladium antarcticum TaxID=1450529 RepID=A0AAN6UPW0_9PEZI|nr:hypothetical protein BT67DRAFT_189605 [Trichocladium antarcticum]
MAGGVGRRSEHINDSRRRRGRLKPMTDLPSVPLSVGGSGEPAGSGVARQAGRKRKACARRAASAATYPTLARAPKGWSRLPVGMVRPWSAPSSGVIPDSCVDLSTCPARLETASGPAGRRAGTWRSVGGTPATDSPYSALWYMCLPRCSCCTPEMRMSRPSGILTNPMPLSRRVGNVTMAPAGKTGPPPRPDSTLAGAPTHSQPRSRIAEHFVSSDDGRAVRVPLSPGRKVRGRTGGLSAHPMPRLDSANLPRPYRDMQNERYLDRTKGGSGWLPSPSWC